MPDNASDLAQRLGRQAEAVCRHYLSNGRREGRYWLVGDARNTPGRSMFVRLKGAEVGKGAAGKWTDAATGEHGDLLDGIRESRGLLDFKDVVDEARVFLSLPHPDPAPQSRRLAPASTGSPEAARRLYAVLREADARRLRRIEAELAPATEGSLAEAINDRLRRAAARRIR